jgi:hypothetical protein
VQVYKLKAFARFQRRERVSDNTLARAIERMEQGLIDADLGGGLVKQRIARLGQGKSGGFRTIIAYRHGKRAVFLFGFAKNERATLDDDELAYWQRVGKIYLGLDDDGMALAIAADELMEIPYGEEP